MKRINFVIIICCLFLFSSCNQLTKKTLIQSDWKQQLNKEIILMGHRNWVLVVDKAFPLQNSNGIVTINTEEDFFSVLRYTIDQIDNSSHVKPIIYRDKELNFIGKEQVPEIEDFKKSLNEVLDTLDIKELLHDSVFVKIDNASKLFKILVLKTNQTIPYSSVFFQLDCRYWSSDNEKELRNLMKNF